MAAALALLVAGGEDPGTTPARQSPAPAAGQRSSAVAKSEVAALVARYAAAYSAEALPVLRSLMAPGFERQSGSGPVESRRQALAAYARQFRELDDPSYRVSGLAITTAGGIASARGRYRITSATGAFAGRVRFEMALVGERLLITRITAKPTVATVTRADVAALVDRYAAACSAENVAELSDLFAPRFQRVNLGDPTQSRAEALDTYAEQFSALASPRYRIAGLTIATGARHRPRPRALQHHERGRDRHGQDLLPGRRGGGRAPVHPDHHRPGRHDARTVGAGDAERRGRR